MMDLLSLIWREWIVIGMALLVVAGAIDEMRGREQYVLRPVQTIGLILLWPVMVPQVVIQAIARMFTGRWE